MSTRLHLGTFELDPANTDVRANAGAVFGLAATVFVLLGVGAWAIGQALGLLQVLTIAVVSGLLLAVFVVSISAVYASYRTGLDSDDVTIRPC